MLGGATLIYLLVMALFALVMLRRDIAASVSPSRWLIWGGLVLPAVVLIPLVAYALIAGERLLPLGATPPVRIEAEAHQWQWVFRYPDDPGAGETVGVLHLPAGVPVDMVVTSRDVIHAFWVPQLAGKIDAVPGHTNILRIQADEPGLYQGQCNEFCGTGHTEMRFDVIVHPAAEFSAQIAAPDAAGKAQP